MAVVIPPGEPEPALGERLRAVLRGLCAAAGLLAGAVAALVSARLGITPGIARRAGRAIADEYRRGYEQATDAEVVDDEEVDT
jgi:hypothetical protein